MTSTLRIVKRVKCNSNNSNNRTSTNSNHDTNSIIHVRARSPLQNPITLAYLLMVDRDHKPALPCPSVVVANLVRLYGKVEHQVIETLPVGCHGKSERCILGHQAHGMMVLNFSAPVARAYLQCPRGHQTVAVEVIVQIRGLDQSIVCLHLMLRLRRLLEMRPRRLSMGILVNSCPTQTESITHMIDMTRFPKYASASRASCLY